MKFFPRISKFLTPALICCLIIPLTSCLTLSESYEFKKNGSGSMAYLIDMGELASILKMAKENEKEEDKENDIASQFSFEEVSKKIENIDGISHIEIINDLDKYQFGVNFKFKSLASLNKALNQILITNPEGTEHTFFKMEKNTITRTNHINKDVLASQLNGEKVTDQSISLMESMVYKLNFSFAKPVKVVYSSAEAEMGGKKNKKVMLEASFKTLMDDVTALNTSIVLK